MTELCRHINRPTSECTAHNLHCSYPRCVVKEETAAEFKPGQIVITKHNEEPVKFEFSAPSHPNLEGPVAIVRKLNGSDEQFTTVLTNVEPLTYHKAVLFALRRYRQMADNHQVDLNRFLFVGHIEPIGFHDFINEAIEKTEKGAPICKLNRWLGYIQGILILAGITTVTTERDWTRPYFRPLDFPETTP